MPKHTTQADDGQANAPPLFRVMQAVLPRTDLTQTAKLVLLLLADMVGKNPDAWPGYGYLARNTGCSRRSVFTAVTELERADLITVKRGRRSRPGQPGEPNRYKLTSAFFALVWCKNCNSTSAKSSPGVVQKLQGNLPSKNPAKEPSQEPDFSRKNEKAKKPWLKGQYEEPDAPLPIL